MMTMEISFAIINTTAQRLIDFSALVSVQQMLEINKRKKNQFKSITHLDGDRRMRWLAKQLIVLSRTYREINFVFVNLVEYRAERKR